jgi:NADH:ubiquinone reductase (H+-translocating)
MAWNVVIAGGGFGGFYAARRLEKIMPPQSARITLISDVNFLLYTPLLPGAASGTLEPRHVVIPIREELHGTDIRLGRVTGADPHVRSVTYETGDRRTETIRYDQLIVSVGSVSRVLDIPGLAAHGLGFKTISEAIALRNRALSNLEIAESIEDPEERRKYLTFVFVGAGYAGVEGIAELQDFIADVIERYPRCNVDGTRFILVEAADRIMPEISPKLADWTTDELRSRGIEVRTGTLLKSLGPDSAELSTGETIPTRTLCWTAGVKPGQVVRGLGLPIADNGRIEVDETMRVRGHENVWAIGDCAAVPDAATGGARPTPPTAQHALREGRVVADNVAAQLGRGKVRAFKYKTKGVFVDLGRYQAVANLMGLKLSGRPAWFAARTYHLVMMPGTSRKLRLMVDWTVGLIFGRDSSELGQLGHPPSLGGFVEQRPRESGSDVAS